MTAGEFPSDEKLSLFWGDFHKHITQPESHVDRMDEIINHSKYHLDVYAVLCYPFEWFVKGKEGGIREETVQQRPKFSNWWEKVQEASAAHLDEGEFVTFPAYEWHGNRTQWGDHNVIYFEEGQPLDDERHIEDLYENLTDRQAVALPHHTGYMPGNRGKDWDYFDAALSPVMEVYSGHGSSEGVSTPVSMTNNTSMGPRTSGGTYIDALDRGHRVGAIASNDGYGLPGAWGNGIAGIWAEELTREGIWDALLARRTYGVTGDRIKVWWDIDGQPMGSVISTVTDPTVAVAIDCPQPLDRIELIGNGRVAETYTHQDSWTKEEANTGVFNVLIEFGWGPSSDYGDFEETVLDWSGTVQVTEGTLKSVQPRFSGFGQEYHVTEDNVCQFDLTTMRAGNYEMDPIQGLICRIKADEETAIAVDLSDGDRFRYSLEEMLSKSYVQVFADDVRSHVEEAFELTEADVRNPDLYYHNAPKLKIHQAHPHAACAATIQFQDLPAAHIEDYYYVRASQVNGQYAWTSPIWVEE